MKAFPISNDPFRSELRVRSMNLVALRCENLDRTIAFYQALGLSFSRYSYGGETEECASARIPDSVFALTADDPQANIPTTILDFQPRGNRQPTTAVAIGFFVRSVDQAMAAGVAAGGTVVTPAANWGWGRLGALADPDGHRVELSECPTGRITGAYPEGVEAEEEDA